MPRQRPIQERLAEAQAKVDLLRAQMRAEKELEKVRELRKSGPRPRRRR